MTTAHIRTTWGPRAETPDSAAEKLHALIEALSDIDGSLTGWRDQALSKKNAQAQPLVIPRLDDLRARLLVGRQVVHDQNTIGERGTALSWWTAADGDEAAVLSVRLGITAPNFGFNAVTLQLPDSAAVPTLYGADVSRRLLSTIIDIVHPDRGVWITREIESQQKESNRKMPDGTVAIGTVVGQPAGWATYLRNDQGDGFDRALLPATAEASNLADGVLVTLAGAPTNPELADVFAVRAAMGYRVPTAVAKPATAPPVEPVPGPGVGASGPPMAQTRERQTPGAVVEDHETPSADDAARGDV